MRGGQESLKKVTCWEPGSYSLWSRIEAFWVVNLLWASCFQNKVSAAWEGNVSKEMLYSEIWNAAFQRCAVAAEDELGNTQHLSFIIWILVWFIFFLPRQKLWNTKASWYQIDRQYIDSCWCASSTAVTQTAACYHLHRRLPTSQPTPNRSRGSDTTSSFVQFAAISADLSPH